MTMNPMTQGRYQPIAAQAEITRKCQFDVGEARMRKANANDNAKAAQCYPGGALNDNLKVYPGELVFGRKKLNPGISYMGRPSELGFTSLAGLYYGDSKSDEALMDDYYFIGIAKTEFEYGGDNMFCDDPLDHGFSVIGAGSYSTINRSDESIHAGDLLIWEFPSTNRTTGGISKEQIRKANIKAGSSAGPFTKVLPYLRPYKEENPLLLATHILNVYTRARNDGGLGSDFATALPANPSSDQQMVRDFLVAHDAFDTDNAQTVAALLKEAFKWQRRQLDRVVGIAMGPSAPGQTLDVMLSHYKCF